MPPAEVARLPIRMRAPRLAATFGIVALSAIVVTTFFVDGLQYSVLLFLPFLGVISVIYMRTRHSVARQVVA